MSFNLDDITDPTDWPKTEPHLREMDSLLRCPVCADFYNAAMNLPCGHNFCSLCIRECLSAKLECPQCRQSVSQPQIRVNRVLDDLVKCFQQCRPNLLDLVSMDRAPIPEPVPEPEPVIAQPPKPSSARSKASSSSSAKPLSSSNQTVNEDLPPRRATRASARNPLSTISYAESPSSSPERPNTSTTSASRSAKSRSNANANIVSLLSSEQKPFVEDPVQYLQAQTSASPSARRRDDQTNNAGGGTLSNSSSASNLDIASYQPQGDELVDCPICQQKLKSRNLNQHIDRNCPKESEVAVALPPAMPSSSGPSVRTFFGKATVTSTTKTTTANSTFALSSSTTTTSTSTTVKSEQPRQYLPTIVYNYLNEKQLRRKLEELGIPSYGDKATMKRRHSQYVIMYNANADAPNPKSNRQLLEDLREWERVLDENDRAKRLKIFHGHKNAEGFVLGKISRETNSYVQQNEDQFQKLIAEAKRSRELAAAAKKKAEEENGNSNNNNEEGVSNETKTDDVSAGVEFVQHPQQPPPPSTFSDFLAYDLNHGNMFDDEDFQMNGAQPRPFSESSRLGGLCGPKDSPPADSSTTTTTATTTTTTAATAMKSQFSPSVPQKRPFQFM